MKRDSVIFSRPLMIAEMCIRDRYEALANDAHAVYADPQFADVTDYTAGSWADGKTTLGLSLIHI